MVDEKMLPPGAPPGAFPPAACGVRYHRSHEHGDRGIERRIGKIGRLGVDFPQRDDVAQPQSATRLRAWCSISVERSIPVIRASCR